MPPISSASSNPGQYTLSTLIFSSKSCLWKTRNPMGRQNKGEKEKKRKHSLEHQEENKHEMLLKIQGKKVIGYLKSPGLVSGDRWWCLEQKFLTFWSQIFFENLKKAMDLSLEKCIPGHPLTTFLSLSGNSQNPWNVHGPQVNTLNTIEVSLSKASFYFELLFTNKVLKKAKAEPLKGGNRKQLISMFLNWPLGIE